jgi:hypothetical protein
VARHFFADLDTVEVWGNLTIKDPTIKIESTKEGDTQVARRRVPRRPIQIAVGLLAKGIYYISRAHELGEGGMLIESQNPLGIGQHIVVTIRIPGILQGAIVCKVDYELAATIKGAANRYGVLFEDVEFDLKRKIRNFVASNSGSSIVRTEVESHEFTK